MATGPNAPRRTIETFTIPDIVDLALDGRLRIPDFARPALWAADAVQALFESIVQGVPIGALTLLEEPAPTATVHFGPQTVHAPAIDRAYTVLDGQQRIVALVAALAPDPEDADADADARFDLSLTLPEGRIVASAAGVGSAPALPLRAAFRTRSLLGWWNENGDDVGPDGEEAVDRLVRALREYVLPAYVVRDEDAGQAYEIFTRLNTRGVALSRADVFHAGFVGEDRDENLAGVARALAAAGFGTFAVDTVVDSLLALRGGDPRRGLRGEFGGDEDEADWAGWLDDTRLSLERAITFLRGEGVPHITLMPSVHALPPLAVFFYRHPEPVPWNRRLLARWLWRAWTVHAVGDGDTHLQDASRLVHPNHRSHDGPSEYQALRGMLDALPAVPASIGDHAMRVGTAAGRLALLALATLRPLGPDGVPIDVGASVESLGLDAAAPPLAHGHRRDVAARSFWPRGAPLLWDVPSERVRRSHLVPDSAGALRDGRGDRFVDARRSLLRGAVDALLSNRMELGAPTRPPIADLVRAAELA